MPEIHRVNKALFWALVFVAGVFLATWVLLTWLDFPETWVRALYTLCVGAFLTLLTGAAASFLVAAGTLAVKRPRGRDGFYPWGLLILSAVTLTLITFLVIVPAVHSARQRAQAEHSSPP